jgi:acyl-CoA thioester hydrolase
LLKVLALKLASWKLATTVFKSGSCSATMLRSIPSQTMSSVFTFRRRVEFCETDAAGIAHFSSLVQYAEQAEHALFRSLGTSIHSAVSDGSFLSWPRVRIEFDFHGSARFEDELDILVTVNKLGTKSIAYRFDFKLNEKSIATGQVTSVCCRVDGQGELKSVPIPDELRQLLAKYEAGSCDSSDRS